MHTRKTDGWRGSPRHGWWDGKADRWCDEQWQRQVQLARHLGACKRGVKARMDHREEGKGAEVWRNHNGAHREEGKGAKNLRTSNLMVAGDEEEGGGGGGGN